MCEVNNMKINFNKLLSGLILVLWMITFNYSAYCSIYANNSFENAMKKNIYITDSVDDIDLEKGKTIAIFGTDESSSEISRSDIIMILKFYTTLDKVTVISIPRDSKVAIPSFGTSKINHAFAYGGAPLLESTLENILETDIDYYVRFNFKDFANIVDQLGGVEVTSKKDFIYNSGTTIKKGQSTLNGELALFYVRFRSDSDGDFGRIKRQQEVIQSIANRIFKVKNDLPELAKLTRIFYENADTDIALKDLLTSSKSITNIERITFDCHTLKTASKKMDGIWYEIIDKNDLKKMKELLK